MATGLTFSDLAAKCPSSGIAGKSIPGPSCGAQESNFSSQCPPISKPTRRGKKDRDDGCLDVAAYLRDHGVAYNIKEEDGAHFFRLSQCLFDSSHGQNEASIIQNDKGVLYYKCFHESCKDRRWKDAREKISGGKSLSEYMDITVSSGFSFKEMSEQIDQASNVESIIVELLKKIAASRLTESENELLLKQIRAKTKISLPALRKDLKRIVSEDDETDNAYEVALAVIETVGPENILATSSFIWVWNTGGVWKAVDDRTIKQIIHQVANTDDLTKHFVDSVLDLIKTEVFKEDHQFDTDSAVINCLNGELFFTDGAWQLQPHCREHYLTTQIPINHDAHATAPRYELFLEEIFRDDPDKEDKKQLILEMIGYSLTTSTRFEKFLMLFGVGANGKSVLMSIIEAMAGPKNIAAVQPGQLSNKFQRAHLHNKLVNLVTEIAEGHQMNDAEIKAITSGELTTAEHKNKPPFDFRPFCTCWFGTNHLPHTRDYSEALFRRTLIVQCNRVFTEKEQDRQLIKKLKEEISGILTLALNALAQAMQRGHLTEPASMQQIKQEWRINVDQAHQFVLECCDVGSKYVTTSSVMYEAFVIWAKNCGIHKMLTRNNFSQRLVRLGIGIELLPGSNGGPRRISGIRPNDHFVMNHGAHLYDREIYNRQQLLRELLSENDVEAAANKKEFHCW